MPARRFSPGPPDSAAIAEVGCTENAGSAEDAHAAAMELVILELRRLA